MSLDTKLTAMDATDAKTQANSTSRRRMDDVRSPMDDIPDQYSAQILENKVKTLFT